MQNNRLLLIVAIVLGLTATALSFVYLKRAGADAAAGPKVEASVEILATSRDLAANTSLEPDRDLQILKVPQETFERLARTAVKKEERTSLRGRKIAGPIAANSPLLYSNLVTVTDLQFAPGSRAMTILVSEAGALGGLVVPGDRVDVVVSKKIKDANPIPANAPPSMTSGGQMNPDFVSALMANALQRGSSGGEYDASVILSNVRVLAVGQQLSKSRSEMLFAPPEQTTHTRFSGSGTVTLEVTLDEALQLAKAVGGGSNPVTLLLRSKQIIDESAPIVSPGQ